MKTNIHKICAITKVNDQRLFDNVREALDSGIRWIQYRQKGKSRRELYREALELRGLTRQYRATLTINDYMDIALAVEAEGVHLGQDDLPLTEARRIAPEKMIIGISTHSLRETIGAERGGADYVGFGPVFDTVTKDAGASKGIDTLLLASSMVKIPLIAIGGIDSLNITSALSSDSRVHGAAICTGIFEGSIADNCKRLAKYIQEV